MKILVKEYNHTAYKPESFIRNNILNPQKNVIYDTRWITTNKKGIYLTGSDDKTIIKKYIKVIGRENYMFEESSKWKTR